MTCPTCKTTRSLEFECLDCCLRWLLPMDKETLALNAPVIEIVAGKEHMEKVRQAWKTAKEAG